MKQSKIVQILSKLSTRQRTRFKEYVQSPFFNKHDECRLLLEYVLVYAPDFQSDKLEKEQVFKTLCPKEKYDEVKMNYLNSKLLDLLSDFLAYQKYEQNEFRKKYDALKAVHELQIPKQEASYIRQWELLEAHYPYKNSEVYYEKYLYHEALNQIHLDKKQRLYDEHLQGQNDQLDFFYWAQKLKISCDMTSRNFVIQADYQATYIEDLLQILERSNIDWQKHPIIHIYYQILKTLKTSQDIDYQVLKELIGDYSALFLPEELLVIYDYAENFCIRKINNGFTAYYHEFLAIYKQKLSKKLLFKDGYLPESDYKNIVTAGVRTKDFEWTEKFIHENKKQLKPDIQENAFNYNLAVFYYATKQYKKALQLLATIEITDIAYGVGAKTIQLQTYYELQEFEALLNLIDTFRLYVMRHKTQSDYRKIANLNMLKIVKKVVKLKEKVGFLSVNQLNVEKQKLEEIYNKTSPLSNADWIRAIINNFEF